MCDTKARRFGISIEGDSEVGRAVDEDTLESVIVTGDGVRFFDPLDKGESEDRPFHWNGHLPVHHAAY